MEIKQVETFAREIRKETLKMLYHVGYGHLGGAFSIVEVLAVLYGKQLRHFPNNPHSEERDRVVLSKGHAGPALYSVLACSGYFEKKELLTLNEPHTKLPSHPDRNLTIGVDATTGSLGQGISQACGIAMGFRKKKVNNKVYAIVGDGELNEGQCWEAFQFLAHYQLNNCIVIIDENKKQLDGLTKDIMNPFDIQAKMKAFGFYTLKVKGDDVAAIDNALTQLKEKQSAVCLILDSIKGQGVSFFESMKDNHSVKFNKEEVIQATKKAIKELEEYDDENSL